MFELTGKTILVTGASKGIGASIVALLGRERPTSSPTMAATGPARKPRRRRFRATG